MATALGICRDSQSGYGMHWLTRTFHLPFYPGGGGSKVCYSSTPNICKEVPISASINLHHCPTWHQVGVVRHHQYHQYINQESVCVSVTDVTHFRNVYSGNEATTCTVTRTLGTSLLRILGAIRAGDEFGASSLD